MFSFFRKKDSDGQDVLTQTAPNTQLGTATQPRREQTEQTEQSASTDTRAETAAPDNHYDLSQLSIEVSSSSDNLSPAEEQAAMLHANGQTGEAIKVLLHDKPHFAGKRRLESWLMLFELLQQHHQRDAFEALGLDFVVEFEKTPPTWQEPLHNNKNQPAASAYCVFTGHLAHNTIDKPLQNFYRLLEKNNHVRLDLGKVTAIDTIAAAEILTALQQSHKKPNSLQLIDSQHLISLLKNQIEVGRRHPAEAPFWLLLIELHQVMGLQEEFENLAVDYAITYEVSPPSWDVRQVPKSAEVIAKEEAAAKAQRDAEEQASNRLNGAISADKPEQLAQLGKLVEKSLSPTVDLHYVSRIDFDSAGQILNLAMQWLQEGRQVRFINVNPLIFALLRVMSISDMLTIEPRK
ncbi:hypothetical protein [Chitinibacter sp. S2-10]|uniref:hypothetical protein n=1 Tax=Chitinibacter sp. S2-10 TaxID=3373597 RepID=UPI00397791C1